VIAAPGVLVNDVDVDGDPLTASKLTDPTHGSLTVSANGSFTYTPDTGFLGEDSFTYTVSDGTLVDIGTVSITVRDTIDIEDQKQGSRSTASSRASAVLTLEARTSTAGGQTPSCRPNSSATKSAG